LDPKKERIIYDKPTMRVLKDDAFIAAVSVSFVPRG